MTCNTFPLKSHFKTQKVKKSKQLLPKKLIMGAENSKGSSVVEKSNKEVEKYIGREKYKLTDDDWFNNTNVQSLSFDADSKDWRIGFRTGEIKNSN